MLVRRETKCKDVGQQMQYDVLGFSQPNSVLQTNGYDEVHVEIQCV